MKKKLALILTAVMATACFGGCKKDDSKIVRVYNWGDYIDEEVIEMFEEETGYTVVYDTFETAENMYTKIVNGNASYDVIIPSDYMIERMAKEGRLAQINFDNVPEYANIDDEYKNVSYDPENKYSVPYMWGTMGILYNKTMVNGEITSWRALWDEQYKGEILMMNSQRDSIGITLKMLGYSMNSTDVKELEEAKQALIEQSPLVLAYVVDEGKDKMISGEATLALSWAGDAEYCIKENPDLAYVIPEEGSNIFIDPMAIPSNCKNKEGGEAFINFMCKPDIAAKNAEYIGYSSPSKKARELMGEAGESEVAYPDTTKYDLEFFAALGDDIKLYDEIWTEVTASF